MNAVIASQQLNWRRSLAFDKGLQIPFSPSDLYTFNAKATFSREFRDKAKDHVTALFAEKGVAEKQPIKIPDDACDRIALTDDEFGALASMSRYVTGQDLTVDSATELVLSRNGYQVPAVSLIFVALFVVVFVFLAGNQPS